MDASTYLNNCLWGLYSEALFADDLAHAESIWLVIEGFSRLDGAAASAFCVS